MSVKEMKALYEALRDSGDLLDIFPSLSGDWKTDKKDFKEQYEFNNEALLGGFEFEEDEY